MFYGDRVRETSSTTGTGDLFMDGVPFDSTYQTFQDVFGVTGGAVGYLISHRTLAEVEVGTGSYVNAGQKLVRTNITFSTNGGAAVNFSAGIKDIRYVIDSASTNEVFWPGADTVLGNSRSNPGNVEQLTCLKSGRNLLAGLSISPSAVSGTTNNYAPSSVADALTLRLTCSSDAIITGLTSGTENQIKIVMNIGTATISLAGENGGSTAANRFSVDAFIPPGASVLLRYDATLARWVPEFVSVAHRTEPNLVVGNDTNNQSEGRLFRVSLSAADVITGIANPFAGREATISNTPRDGVAGFPLVLVHESTASAAANRIDTQSGTFARGHLILLPGESATLVYSSAVSGQRWNLTSHDQRFQQTRILEQRPGLTTNPISLGIAHTTNGGTISHPTIVTGGLRVGTVRIRGATGAVAGSQSGSRAATSLCYGGEAGPLGGFIYRVRFGFSAWPATAGAFFIGMTGTTGALGNVNPSTLTNILGVGCDPTETVVQVMRNDGSGTATKVAMSASFPISPSAPAPWYEVTIIRMPNEAAVSFVLQRLDDLTVAPFVATYTTDIPALTTFHSPNVWVCNRAGAADYQLEWGGQELRLLG